MLQLAQKIVALPTKDTKRSSYPQKQRAFAVIYLPATHLLKSLSVDDVFKYCKNKIKNSSNDSSQLICLAIDRWEYKNTKLLNLLYKLFNYQNALLIPVGPSVGEILKTVNSEQTLIQFLRSLSNIGVCTVEGGNNLDCIEIAISENFLIRPSFAVNLEDGFNDSFANKLENIEKIAKASKRIETLTIFPHKKFSEFESNHIKVKSIQKYVNILKNCRKYAKSIPFLRAPISAFGNISPEELAIDEINDYGHFAINHETAIALGLEQISNKHKSLFLS